MVTLNKVQSIVNQHKDDLKKEYSIKRIGVFGSVARGSQTSGSDIDMLVEFNETPDLFKFCKLETYLEDLLGADIDLVRPNALRLELKEQILNEVIYL